MPRPIRLYVSCSPGLAPEREALGQAVAELPVEVGWEIRHSPRPGQDDRDALAFVEHCDLYLVLLGGDFAAPMGSEWRRAVGHVKTVLAYRKRVPYSPSAQTLLRRSEVEWTAFESAAQLKAQVTPAIAGALLDQGEHFGLHLPEVEALLEVAETEVEKKTQAEPDRRRGAGRGGVILGRGKATARG